MNVFEGNDLDDAVNFHDYRSSTQEASVKAISGARGVFYLLQKGPVARNSYAYNLALTSLAVAYRRAQYDSADVSMAYSIVFPDREIPMNTRGMFVLRNA